MSCFGSDDDEAILIGIPKDGDPSKITGPFNTHLLEKHFSPKEAKMIGEAMAAAVYLGVGSQLRTLRTHVKMLREADHEKIGRMYSEGVMSGEVGFKWYMDETPSPIAE